MVTRYFILKCGRSGLNLTLFLVSVWYFFTYGQNDLALSETMEIVVSVGNIVPYFLIPFLYLVLNRIPNRVRHLSYSILLFTGFGLFFAQSLIVWLTPLFASRWTWAFNDLRELNYLYPFFKIVAYSVFMLLVLFDNREVADEILHFEEIDPNQGESMRLFYAFFIIIAFLAWGILQEIISTQSILVSLMILMLLTIGALFINILLNASRLQQKDVDTPSPNSHVDALPLNLRFRTGLAKFFVFLGFFLLSFVIWFFPAQLVYQEGPSNSFGSLLLIGGALAAVMLILWNRLRIPGLWGFVIVIAVNLIAPLIIGLGWNIIPGSVDVGMEFAGIGVIGLFVWLVYYGIRKTYTSSVSLQRGMIWVWGLAGVVLLNDPLFEIWEMEEGLQKVLSPDLYGTGVGLYYGIILLIWLSLSCVTVLCAISIKYLQSRSLFGKKGTHTDPSPLPPERKTAIPIRSQLVATLIIGIVLGGSGLIFTGIVISDNGPTILDRMGDHGVLWQANIYDRVLPKYRPNFAASPENSTVELYAMRGETESIQLVYSPLASKMVSFNYYQWSHSPDLKVADNLWMGPNGTLANISIAAGRIGYLNCFDTNIADVILPWSAFITGTRDNVPFWLDVTVPYGIDPGVYTTHFAFNTNSWLQRNFRTASLEFDLKLTVWNFSKPLNRSMDTCINYFPENPANTDALIELGIRYGVDPYGSATNSIWGPTAEMVTYDPNDLSKGISINWTLFDVEVAKMFDKGMSQIKLDFYPGIDCRSGGEAVLNGSKDNYLTLIEWFYGNASEHLRNKYTPWGTTWESETITQHSDEPDPRISPYAIDAFRKLYKIIDNVTEIKTFQTFMYEPDFDPWLDCLDIWVLTPDSYSIEVAERIRAAGREVWTYSNGDNFPGQDTDLRTPLIMSRLRGWINYKYNITGFLDWVFFWNFNDAGQSGSGYDGRGDGTEIVPIAGGYASTLRLVGFRDGLEDYELLRQLGAAIHLAENSGLSNTQEVIAAKKVMEDIFTALSQQPADVKWNLPVVTREFNHTPSLYLTLRIQAGNALESLVSVL
jgi:hypothetical protein